MRIVHAVYSMEMGGAEMVVAQLCRVQRAQGHDVSVCAYSMRGTLGDALEKEGFAIHVLGAAHPARTMLRYLRYFRKTRPDVVHCHNPAPTLQAALPARIAGAACVVATRHSLVAPPYDRAAEIKFSLISLSVDWITGICDITCNNLRGAPLARRSRIVRVYNGVEPVHDVQTGEASHQELHLLFVGRLALIKDLPTLLRAVALAKLRLHGLRLSVVGDGPVRSQLESLAEELGISDVVTFYGQQMETDRFFTAADVFVMSSTSEGLPMSLLQAMSAGKPAILTNVGGMSEILQRSGGGLLVSVGDAEGMAEAIVSLASDGGLREAMGRQAQAAYLRDFTPESMATAYDELYRSHRLGRASQAGEP